MRQFIYINFISCYFGILFFWISSFLEIYIV